MTASVRSTSIQAHLLFRVRHFRCLDRVSGSFRSSFYLNLQVSSVPASLLPSCCSRRHLSGARLIALAWLAGKGKYAKGEKALKWLVGNVEGYDVSHEFKVIVAEVEESKALVAEKSSSDRRLIFRGVNLKRSIIATLPFTFTVCLSPCW